MPIHNRFAILEAAAERGDATAKDGLDIISETIAAAFSAAMGTPWHAMSGTDAAERVAEALAVWLEDSSPDLFAKAAARAAWPDMIRDAIAATELVGATNDAAILSEYSEGANKAHAAALSWQASAQSALARALGWLDSDSEPRLAEDVPAFAALLAGGDASLAELRAFDPWNGSAVNLGRSADGV